MKHHRFERMEKGGVRASPKLPPFTFYKKKKKKKNPPPPTMLASPIPASFARKKAAILANLSLPTDEYQDRSPKGSVDYEIRDLIDEINAYEGLVTTSNCGSRVAIVLEGNKARGHGGDATAEH